jgi:hypothetical protein
MLILPRDENNQIDINDIPKFVSEFYTMTLEWHALERWITNEIEESNLEINPPFQRGYVWNEEQKIRYVEYILKNGTSSRDIYFNNPIYFHNEKAQAYKDYVCVDGLQRITAVRDFMTNKFPVFGQYYRKDFKHKRFPTGFFNCHIAQIIKESDVMQWYIDLNTGGTVHTEKDLKFAINRIKELRGD